VEVEGTEVVDSGLGVVAFTAASGVAGSGPCGGSGWGGSVRGLRRLVAVVFGRAGVAEEAALEDFEVDGVDARPVELWGGFCAGFGGLAVAGAGGSFVAAVGSDGVLEGAGFDGVSAGAGLVSAEAVGDALVVAAVRGCFGCVEAIFCGLGVTR